MLDALTEAHKKHDQRRQDNELGIKSYARIQAEAILDSWQFHTTKAEDWEAQSAAWSARMAERYGIEVDPTSSGYAHRVAMLERRRRQAVGKSKHVDNVWQPARGIVVVSMTQEQIEQGIMTVDGGSVTLSADGTLDVTDAEREDTIEAKREAALEAKQHEIAVANAVEAAADENETEAEEISEDALDHVEPRAVGASESKLEDIVSNEADTDTDRKVGMYESSLAYTLRIVRELQGAGKFDTTEEQEQLRLLKLYHKVVKTTSRKSGAAVDDGVFELWMEMHDPLRKRRHAPKPEENEWEYVARVWHNLSRRVAAHRNKYDANYKDRAESIVASTGDDAYADSKAMTEEVAVAKLAKTLPPDPEAQHTYTVVTREDGTKERVARELHHVKTSKVEAKVEAVNSFYKRTHEPFSYKASREAQYERLMSTLRTSKTPKDADVLKLLRNGYSVAEIQHMLELTPKAFENSAARLKLLAEENRTPEEKAQLAEQLERFDHKFYRDAEKAATESTWGVEHDWEYYEKHVPSEAQRLAAKRERTMKPEKKAERERLEFEGWEAYYEQLDAELEAA
jgi:DNA-binding transcriptional MerR regulator